MTRRTSSVLAILLLIFCVSAFAKKKEKPVLPEVVVRAQTVLVMIQPGAAEPLTDPRANQKAQEEVEKALMSWGRFRFVMETESADLVIAVRKGTGKASNPTISGGPVDKRPVILETTDNQIRVGASNGRPPGTDQTEDPTQRDPAQDSRPHPGMEIGAAEDSLKVFQGGPTYSQNGAALWSYQAKNALRPPDVTAVAEFRKAIEEAENAATQKKKPQQPQSSTPPPLQQPKTP